MQEFEIKYGNMMADKLATMATNYLSVNKIDLKKFIKT